MEESEIQQRFFSHIKSLLPKHLSLVDVMTDLLDLSHDSIYRRIRGEKPITLKELKILCEHFQVSLDQVLQIQNNSIVFLAPETGRDEYDFGAYLRGMKAQLDYFNSFDNRKLMYITKDIPVFHFFQLHDLAVFKSFFWIKSIINHPDYQKKNFSFGENSFEEFVRMGFDIVKAYNEIPSVEIWNFESVNSMISQIEYYREAGIFANKEDLVRVLDSLDQLLSHLEHQVSEGCKFMHGAGEAGYRATLKFYYNELILGNNSGIVELDGRLSCFVNHGVIHYLMTSDERFNKRAFNNYNTLINRSTMISQTGEKERNRFFNTLREQVRSCKTKSIALMN